MDLVGAVDEPSDLEVPVFSEVGAPVLARCADDLIFEYPKDLYIPPDALRLFLEKFEGPFDLLLYLIRKKNLDILEVSVSAVTHQYLGYVDCLFSSRSYLSVEYLVMASLLIHLKTRMLLPKMPSEEDDEGEDPRAVLVKRLEEYEKIKGLSAVLSELPVLGKDFFSPCIHLEDPPSAVMPMPLVRVEDLARVWKKISERCHKINPFWLKEQHLSVREHMTAILRMLSACQSCLFTHLLIETPGMSFIVVYFIALLQLIRDQLVCAEQKNDGNISIFLLSRGDLPERSEQDSTVE